MRMSVVGIAVAAILFGLFGTPTSVNGELAPWQRQEMSDPLRGTRFSQFSLDGKFLTAPREKPNATPIMIVRCISGKGNHGHTNGKFLNGYVHVGGVMNSEVSENGNAIVAVEFRLDDGKLQSESWGRCTDFSSIFFTHPNCPLCGSGYANNHFAGHAPATIKQFQELWQAKGLPELGRPQKMRQESSLFPD